MPSLILIESFPQETDAIIAKGQLEAAGIRSQLRLNPMGDTLLGAVGLQNGPTDLLVYEEEVEKAKEVLGA